VKNKGLDIIIPLGVCEIYCVFISRPNISASAVFRLVIMFEIVVLESDIAEVLVEILFVLLVMLFEFVIMFAKLLAIADAFEYILLKSKSRKALV